MFQINVLNNIYMYRTFVLFILSSNAFAWLPNNEELKTMCTTIEDSKIGIRKLRRTGFANESEEKIKNWLRTKDHSGKTPLHICIKRGHRSLSKLLLELDCSMVNLQDVKGRTALHYAVEDDDAELSGLLLLYSANPEIYDFNGITPIAISNENHFNVINNLCLSFSVYSQNHNQQPQSLYNFALVVACRAYTMSQIQFANQYRGFPTRYLNRMISFPGYKLFHM